jgi:hypothetical protein
MSFFLRMCEISESERTAEAREQARTIRLAVWGSEEDLRRL